MTAHGSGFVRIAVLREQVRTFPPVQRTELIARMEDSLRGVGEKNGLIVSAFMLRNLAFLKEYADSVEEKQIALEKQQTRQYQAKRIEALARGREQRIKLLAAARAAHCDQSGRSQAGETLPQKSRRRGAAPGESRPDELPSHADLPLYRSAVGR